MSRSGPCALVTGAAGYIGQAVIRALHDHAVPVCAVDTTLGLFANADAPDRDLRRAIVDDRNPLTLYDAIQGCSVVVLIRPPNRASVESMWLPFLQSAESRGIKHIVMLSVLEGAPDWALPHYALERILGSVGVKYTILRPGLYVQHLAVEYRRDIVSDGRIYIPAPRGPVALVDLRDVAEATARIVKNGDVHHGAIYTCVGPDVLSFFDIAQVMSDVLKWPIRCESISIADYIRRIHRDEPDLGRIAVQTVLHVGLRVEATSVKDTTLRDLLGRTPTSLAAYVREYAPAWEREKRHATAHHALVDV